MSDRAPVIDLRTRRPRRPVPGHAGHFHPALVGPALIVTCPDCRDRIRWHAAQLDAWEKENR